MKKLFMCLLTAALVMVGASNVKAAGTLDSLLKVYDAEGKAVTTDNCSSLSNYIAAIPEGGTLQLQKDITATDGITDSFRMDSATVKNMTLDLNGHKIVATNGPAVIIGSGTTKVNVTIKGGTGSAIISTKASSDIITVSKGSNLDVSDTKIYYKDGAEENTLLTETTNPYITGIHVFDESTVSMTNTTIYANYAVWVSGAKNKVTISKSDLHGYAALDISNGSSNKGNNVQAEGNVVTVNESTLTGHNPYAASDGNAYGTVVIGGQKGLALTITKSTVTNDTKNNTEDLIVFSESYADSEGAEVNVSESKLTNTDKDHGSSVFNYSSVKLASANSIVSTKNTLTGNVYPTPATAEEDTIVYVTVVYTEDGVEKEETKAYASSKVSEELKKYLDALTEKYVADDYEVEGYYTDAKYENKLNFEQGIVNNLKVYLKATKIVEPEATPDPEPEENPNTLDNVMAYVAAGLTSVIGVTALGLSIKRKMHN